MDVINLRDVYCNLVVSAGKSSLVEAISGVSPTFESVAPSTQPTTRSMFHETVGRVLGTTHSLIYKDFNRY